ncbi:hypothetical protein ACQEVZ_45590 [Dactylosporangium sp. CA-152071]|uniref:hypothetical protein n=1 Tax=Dactylosporangium sp. CA-152071 TaxID=3239933 RepID=UPI003D8FB3F6
MIRVVYQVGLNRGVSESVMLAGFEAGWIESHMNDLPCGDKDALDGFQQRPSFGWGTPERSTPMSNLTRRLLIRMPLVAAAAALIAGQATAATAAAPERRVVECAADLFGPA